jgi:hypothetical protein
MWPFHPGSLPFSCGLQTGEPAPLIAEDVNAIIQANAERINAAIDFERDMA